MKTPLSFVLCLLSSTVIAATYGTLDGQSNFVAAPPTVTFDNGLHVTTHITEAEANALGYKLVIDDPPTCASNQYAVATGYVLSGVPERIVRQYELHTVTPAPRRFSKLKIYGAIAKLGAWSKIEAWLQSKTVNGINGWTAFTLAQELSEDHALFAPLAEEARQLLGLTQEQFDALLNQCILEG